MEYFRSEDSHKHWVHLPAPLRTNPKTRTPSIISLTFDRLCAVATFEESMFQWPTMLSVKNLYLKTNLNFPLSSFILLKQFPERGSQHLPLHCSISMGSPPSLHFSKMRKSSDLNASLKSCPWVLSPSAWPLSCEYTPEIDVHILRRPKLTLDSRWGHPSAV